MGIPSYSTMQVLGSVGTKRLHILVDNGSTHNFMKESLAQRLGGPITSIPNVRVTVANGNNLACVNLCRNFQANWFKGDMLLDKLRHCFGSTMA